MSVVVGYIPNRYGEAALEAGVEEARRRNTRLVVVNSSKGDAYIDTKFANADQLADLDRRLSNLGIETDLRQSVGADVADEVLAVVDEVDADLLVLGIRHRTPVGKMLMGSVAQRLLLDAACPVLAVKAPT